MISGWRVKCLYSVNVLFPISEKNSSSPKISKRQFKGRCFGCPAIYKLLLFRLKSCWLLKTLPKKKKKEKITTRYYGHLLLSHYFAICTPTWLPWTPLKRNHKIMLPKHMLGLQSDYKWLLKKSTFIPFIVSKRLYLIVPRVCWGTVVVSWGT